MIAHSSFGAKNGSHERHRGRTGCTQADGFLPFARHRFVNRSEMITMRFRAPRLRLGGHHEGAAATPEKLRKS